MKWAAGVPDDGIGVCPTEIADFWVQGPIVDVENFPYKESHLRVVDRELARRARKYPIPIVLRGVFDLCDNGYRVPLGRSCDVRLA